MSREPAMTRPKNKAASRQPQPRMVGTSSRQASSALHSGSRCRASATAWPSSRTVGSQLVGGASMGGRPARRSTPKGPASRNPRSSWTVQGRPSMIASSRASVRKMASSSAVSCSGRWFWSWRPPVGGCCLLVGRCSSPAPGRPGLPGPPRRRSGQGAAGRAERALRSAQRPLTAQAARWQPDWQATGRSARVQGSRARHRRRGRSLPPTTAMGRCRAAGGLVVAT
jgi:hypothetical protein